MDILPAVAQATGHDRQGSRGVDGLALQPVRIRSIMRSNTALDRADQDRILANHLGKLYVRLLN
jgi:hypothetical protein